MILGRKPRDAVNGEKIEVIVKNFEAFDRRLYLCAKHTGSCTTVRGTTVPGTVL